jgi:hypothetical protein
MATIRRMLVQHLAEAYRAGGAGKNEAASDYSERVVDHVAHDLQISLGRMVEGMELVAEPDQRLVRAQLAAACLAGNLRGHPVDEAARQGLALADELIRQSSNQVSIDAITLAFDNVQCDCSVRQRDSGHKSDCWYPALEAAVKGQQS